MWELDHKESRVPKNWCLWTVVLEKTPENPLDSKEIRSVNLKGNQLWILVGRTDTEAEALIFWSSDANSWLIGKVPDAGKDWGQKEKRASEDEMDGWHHWCNEHELGQTLGDGEGRMGLASLGSQRVGHNWVTKQKQQSARLILSNSKNWRFGNWFYIEFKHNSFSIFLCYKYYLAIWFQINQCDMLTH